MFSCSDSLVLHIVAIFCNLHERNQFSLIELYDKLGLNFKNTWPIFTALRLILCYIEFCFGKCFDHLTWFWLSLWYIRLEFEKHLNYLTGLKLILSNIRLGLIKLINRAGDTVTKDEDLLKLYFKQLVILSSPISLGQVMNWMWKIKC